MSTDMEMDKKIYNYIELREDSTKSWSLTKSIISNKGYVTRVNSNITMETRMTEMGGN